VGEDLAHVIMQALLAGMTDEGERVVLLQHLKSKRGGLFRR
jgi:hypothetical protein